jgi:GNAT superfamily N-acetyltransferase
MDSGSMHTGSRQSGPIHSDPTHSGPTHSGPTHSGPTHSGPTRIRPARVDELAALQDIERAAGRCFYDIGMAEIADDEPLGLEELAEYQRAGRAWVAVDGTDHPVAYLVADLIDGNVHIEQVSVHPDNARRGVGRSLLEHVAGWAATEGVPALTLSTFAQVPWNAPYYILCGFRILDETQLTPGLRAIRRREAEYGLDLWPRVCMRLDL